MVVESRDCPGKTFIQQIRSFAITGLETARGKSEKMTRITSNPHMRIYHLQATGILFRHSNGKNFYPLIHKIADKLLTSA